MPTRDKTLSESVDELLESHRYDSFHATTGTVAGIAELVKRTEGLELAVHRLAVEVERLQALVASERH